MGKNGLGNGTGEEPVLCSSNKSAREPFHGSYAKERGREMISARNYAHQVYNFLIDRKDKRYIELAQKIKNAVHYVLPDGGAIFDDNLKGLKNQTIHLPYPAITVEFCFNYNSGELAKVLVYAEEKGNEIYFYLFVTKNKVWLITGIYCYIDCDWDFKSFILCYHDKEAKIKCENFLNTLSDEERKRYHKELEHDMYASIEFTLELCEALTCKNVKSIPIQEGLSTIPNRNGKLTKIKPPFFETKMLVIDVNDSTYTKYGTPTGKHKSPRQHLRRGHIRRLESGNNIWVTSCVVGDKSNGVIEKIYVMKGKNNG